MTESAPPHPLDGCDPTECYQTMMAERTALITARRESEDNLIKTVIQLSAALLALLAGFISQAKITLSLLTLTLFACALAALAVAIIAGLWEQRFASKAYLDQQKLVEDYFQKNIAEFEEPPANKSVRRAQTTAFITFVSALLCLGIFAFVEARESYVEAKGAATSAATASTEADRRWIQGRSGEIRGSEHATASPSKEVGGVRDGR